MNIEIVDDFLSDYQCDSIGDFLASKDMMWRFNKDLNDTGYVGNYYFYYYVVMQYFDPQKNYVEHEFLPAFQPLLDKLGIDLSQIWRLKVNLYPGTQRRFHHQSHTDYEPGNGLRTCLYFPHTTNAPVVFHLGRWRRRSIKCKRNRLLLFDGSNRHHSTSPTDSNYTTSINIDYRV